MSCPSLSFCLVSSSRVRGIQEGERVIERGGSTCLNLGKQEIHQFALDTFALCHSLHRVLPSNSSILEERAATKGFAGCDTVDPNFKDELCVHHFCVAEGAGDLQLDAELFACFGFDVDALGARYLVLRDAGIFMVDFDFISVVMLRHRLATDHDGCCKSRKEWELGHLGVSCGLWMGWLGGVELMGI